MTMTRQNPLTELAFSGPMGNLHPGCGLTLQHYADMLADAVESGYALTDFRHYHDVLSSGRKVILLRHDLDYGRGLPVAARMAEIEKKLGARATYFVRVHSPEYNPFEYQAYGIIKGLIDLGHEIGLHFEAHDFHVLTGEDELAIIKKEKAILERAFDIEIVSAAEHGENHRLSSVFFQPFFARHAKADVPLINDAYEFQCNREIKYLSDSDGRWREGCLCSHLDDYSGFHVLIHPEWWIAGRQTGVRLQAVSGVQVADV